MQDSKGKSSSSPLAKVDEPDQTLSSDEEAKNTPAEVPERYIYIELCDLTLINHYIGC